MIQAEKNVWLVLFLMMKHLDFLRCKDVLIVDRAPKILSSQEKNLSVEQTRLKHRHGNCCCLNAQVATV